MPLDLLLHPDSVGRPPSAKARDCRRLSDSDDRAGWSSTEGRMTRDCCSRRWVGVLDCFAVTSHSSQPEPKATLIRVMTFDQSRAACRTGFRASQALIKPCVNRIPYLLNLYPIPHCVTRWLGCARSPELRIPSRATLSHSAPSPRHVSIPPPPVRGGSLHAWPAGGCLKRRSIGRRLWVYTAANRRVVRAHHPSKAR